MNFIPTSRSPRFTMSRVLTLVIALVAFGAALGTGSKLYAQFTRYNSDGTEIISTTRVNTVLSQGTPLAVGDYVEVDRTAPESDRKHGGTSFIIPDGADFTIKPSSGSYSVAIDAASLGSGGKPAFIFNNDSATLNLDNVYYRSGSQGNQIFLHMDSGELTLNLKNYSSIDYFGGLVTSSNKDSKVIINAKNLYLYSYKSASGYYDGFAFFGFGNSNGASDKNEPLKVDIKLEDIGPDWEGNERDWSTLTLDHLVRGLNGSAVYTSGFTSKSAYITIQDNSASNSGGAIYATGDSEGKAGVSLIATFKDYPDEEKQTLRISRNTAVAGDGGAIYKDSIGDIYIESGAKISLTNNRATSGNGGAIYNVGDGNIKLLSKDNEMYVIDNRAINGGVIYNDTGENSYEKSVVLSAKNNSKFTISSNIASDDGGVIYNEGASVSIDSESGLVNINSNKAQNGGVIYNDGSNNTDGISTVKISSTNNNINLTGNKATDGSGGAIYSIDSNVKFNAKSVIITGHSAHISGGVIYNQGAAATGIEFDANKVIVTDNYVSTGSGGFIYNEGANVNISADAEVTIKRNEAIRGNGGAIYSGDLKDQSGKVQPAENTVSIATTSGPLTISYNEARNGGAIYSTAKELSIAADKKDGADPGKLTFEDNVALHDGGAIYNNSSAVSDAKLSIKGMHNDTGAITLSRNGAGGSGGAIYNANAEMDLYSEGWISAQDNDAEVSGGMIYNDSAKYDFSLECSHLNVLENRAGVNGGAIYLKSKTNSFEGTKLHFQDNEAGVSGGAIYEVAVTDGSTTFNAYEQILFTDNIAKNDSGGAIYRTAAEGATNIGALSFKAIDELVIN